MVLGYICDSLHALDGFICPQRNLSRQIITWTPIEGLRVSSALGSCDIFRARGRDEKESLVQLGDVYSTLMFTNCGNFGIGYTAGCEARYLMIVLWGI